MAILITKAVYDELPPYEQGFAQYWHGDQPGSELKDLSNPYPKGSKKAARWDEGAMAACLAAQDSEE